MTETGPLPDENEEDGPLLDLASRLVRGEPIDWDAARLTTAAPAVVNALLDIAAVEAAHRRAEESFDPGAAQPVALERRWGHLVILERVGSGQFGEVYRAFDPSLQTEVALKLSAADAPPEYARQMIEEARLLARVLHPNVVRVHGAELRGRRAGFWMDLIRGRTLEQILKTQRFSAPEAARVGVELCRALAAVHAGNVLHGDVKAHNVMRSDDGETVLIDFGAGRALDQHPAGFDLAGTLVYLAPEVLSGEPRTRQSDIYSLGVLLFYLVTDTFPVFGATLDAIRTAHAAGDVKHLRDCRPGLPDWFVHVVERATAPDPARRYATAGAMESDLSPGRRQEIPFTENARPVLPQALRFRHWMPWLAGAAAVILAVGVTLFLTGIPGGPSEPATSSSTPVASSPDPATARPSGLFGIQAAFHRVAGQKVLERLKPDDVVRVDDELSLTVTLTAPAFIYVVNEDEAGESYLLFPLPGQGLVNPLPAHRDLRLPGAYNWQVSTAGGKEHFLVFASADRLDAFEEVFRNLPAARANAVKRSEKLPKELQQQFRGVGGLTPQQPQGSGLRHMFTTPLQDDDAVTGLWVRQLTLINGSSR